MDNLPASPIIEPEVLELTRDLDLDAFWAENVRCTTFTTHKPRGPVSFAPDDHWIFEFIRTKAKPKRES